MLDAGGSEHQIAAAHRTLLVTHCSDSLPFQHQVQLVLVGVNVSCMLLAGFKAVEAGQARHRSGGQAAFRFAQ